MRVAPTHGSNDGRLRPADRRLSLALAITCAVFIAALVDLLVGDPAFPPSSRDLIGLLVAAGALCLAALTAARTPVEAWPALVLSGIAATGIPVRLAAALESGTATEWVPAALVVAGCASGAVVVAALYATRPERVADRRVRRLAWVLAAWTVGAALATVPLALAGQRDRPGLSPIDIITFPVAAWLPIVVGLAAVGMVADLRPAIGRTRLRVAVGGAVRPGPSGWLATFGDELLGRGEGRRSAAEAERRRLASDLHAEVMPALRRALHDVEAGRPAEEVAAELRAVAGELEGVMTERRDPVLEALGLVRALEALAERTEDRGGPRVELIVGEGSGPVSKEELAGHPPLAGRPPLAVESAALRIAGLAIDNAVRHGRATAVEVLVTVSPGQVTLRVADDGSGIGATDEARAMAEGRHGIADMRRLAADAGGRLSVGRGPDECGGTVVRLDWPA